MVMDCCLLLLGYVASGFLPANLAGHHNDDGELSTTTWPAGLNIIPGETLSVCISMYTIEKVLAVHVSVSFNQALKHSTLAARLTLFGFMTNKRPLEYMMILVVVMKGQTSWGGESRSLMSFFVKREDLLSFSLMEDAGNVAGCVGCVGNDLLGGFLWRDGSPADGTRPGCLLDFVKASNLKGGQHRWISTVFFDENVKKQKMKVEKDFLHICMDSDPNKWHQCRRVNLKKTHSFLQSNFV